MTECPFYRLQSIFLSLLILILASIQYKFNGANISTEAFARMTATINPIARTRFFETTCRDIFEYSLAAGSKNGGLFSLISTYFGTVETNDQRILHFLCLVWLHSAFYITQLRERLQADFKYIPCVVEFIDRIIRCSIIPEDKVYAPQSNTLLASFNESDSSFVLKLDIDSNAFMRKCQMYLSTHNATCYKYGAAATGQYRFDFPCPMNEQTRITLQDIIEVFKNNIWINPWCLAIVSLIWSNHNINFIPSNVKALAFVWYITNYTTKSDCNQYYCVMETAFVCKAFEDAATWPGHKNLAKQIWFIDVDKFAFCALNWLAYDREISGPFAPSSLLGLFEYYTLQHSPKKINQNTFRRKIALQFFPKEANMNFSNQLIPWDRLKTLPPSMFDNYQWRRSELAQYCLYDYFKLVTIVSNKTGEGVLFAKEDPHFPSDTQCFCNAGPCKTLVALFGPLTLIEVDKDAIWEGIILLGLFVSWDRLQSRFLLYNATVSLYSSLPWQIWLDVK